MKASLNCSRPALFRGKEAKAQAVQAQPVAVSAKKADETNATKPQLKPQLKADTVQISAKNVEVKSDSKTAVKSEVKTDAKVAAKTPAKAEVQAKPAAKCEGDACKK